MKEIYLADRGKSADLKTALEVINEKWLEEWSCYCTTLDLVDVIKELLKKNT